MLALMVKDVADNVCVSIHVFRDPKPSMLTCKKRTLNELFSVLSGEIPAVYSHQENGCASGCRITSSFLCRCLFLLSLEAHAVLRLGPFGGSQSGLHVPAWGSHAAGSEAPVSCLW